MPLMTDPKPACQASDMSTLQSANGPMPEYHILVGESTTKTGGMCAHMKLLADGLAASSPVHVWSPDVTDLVCESPEVHIHKTLGTLSVRDLRLTGKQLNEYGGPLRLLVYWVPHAYGHHAMNVPFCLWLWFRSAWRKDRIELMVQGVSPIREGFRPATRRR